MNLQQLQQADWLDILFDQRNKLYGAYFLRRTYEKRLRLALLSMSFVIIAGSFWIMKKNHIIKILPPVVRDLTPISLLPSVMEPPPPPPPPPSLPKPLNASFVKYVNFRVTPDKLVPPNETPPDISQLKNVNIALVNMKGDNKSELKNILQSANATGVTQNTEEEKTVPFIPIEKMPEFPGGEKAMLAFLATHLQFTERAREASISGTVQLSFVVDARGKIKDIKIVKGLGYGLDEAAINAVQAMPRWKPGIQNGMPAPVIFQLPITFVLQ